MTQTVTHNQKKDDIEIVAEETAIDENSSEKTRVSSQTKERLFKYGGVAGLTASIIYAVASGNTGTALILFGIVFLIMFHEAGHFVAARLSGVKATEYFVGFGPRLFSFKKGETEYGARVLPLGGFVKLVGMTNLEKVSAEDESRAYRNASYGKQLFITSAGPAMNFLLAAILIWVTAVFVGIPNGDTSLKIDRIIDIGDQSPAAAAGLLSGDEILTVDGQRVTNWEKLRDKFQSSANVTMDIGYKRDGKTYNTNLTPVRYGDLRTDPNMPATDADQGLVGVSMRPAMNTVGPLAGVTESWYITKHFSTETMRMLKEVFSPKGMTLYAKNVVGEVPKEQQAVADQTRFVSILGIANYAKTASSDGWYSSLMLLALINVSVGLINLVPLLPFDGGHIVVTIYSWAKSVITRRRSQVDFAKLNPIMNFVVILFILIALSAVWLDIVRPVGV